MQFRYVLIIVFLISVSIGIMISPATAWLGDLHDENSTIRAAHFHEIRSAIDTKRVLCGLEKYDWTNPTLIPGTTPVRKIHMDELRAALSEISSTHNEAIPSFTDDNIEAGETPIKKEHISELRAYVDTVACCGDGDCNGTETNSSCVQDCTCDYGGWVTQGCGRGDCDSDEMQQVRRDSSGAAHCPDIYQCVESLGVCCNYGSWSSQGCGLGSCAVTQQFQSRTAPEDGCLTEYRCRTTEACCFYEAPVDAGCGDGPCPSTHMHVTTASGIPECADKSICEAYHQTCCNYSGWDYRGCAEGPCGSGKQLRVKTPANSDCPLITQCLSNRSECCDWEDDWVDTGCGGGSCPSHEMQQKRRAQTSGCSDKSQCVSSDDCAECSGGSTQNCTKDGCPGIRSCNDGNWGSCKVSGSICKPGSTRGCTDSSGESSIQTCNSCGTGWSSCSCQSGQTISCSTGDGCSGLRTCVQDRWSKCEPKEEICTPGAKIDCSKNGRPGVRYCNSCGDGYGNCRCIPGSTISCYWGFGRRVCDSSGNWSNCKANWDDDDDD